MTPAHCRAMRGWLGWSQADLAGRAGMSTGAVAEFEGGRPGRKSTLARLAYAFAQAGCHVVPAPLHGIVWRKPKQEGE